MATLQLSMREMFCAHTDMTDSYFRQNGNNCVIEIWLEHGGVRQVVRMGEKSNAPALFTMAQAARTLIESIMERAEDELGRDYDEIEDEIQLTLEDERGNVALVESKNELIAYFIADLITQTSIKRVEYEH